MDLRAREMLFEIAEDPSELNYRAPERPEQAVALHDLPMARIGLRRPPQRVAASLEEGVASELRALRYL